MPIHQDPTLQSPASVLVNLSSASTPCVASSQVSSQSDAGISSMKMVMGQDDAQADVGMISNMIISAASNGYLISTPSLLSAVIRPLRGSQRAVPQASAG
jgi:hypothetical protein